MAEQRKGENKQQGRDERIRYALDATPAPASVGAVTVWDLATGDDVTAAVTTGAAAMEDGVIYTPVLHSLVPGHTYRVEVRYLDAGGNVLEPYFVVEGER